MAKASGTTKASSSSSPKGISNNASYNAIVNSFSESYQSSVRESIKRVSKMTDDEKGSIEPSLSKAMDYTVAVMMSKERSELLSVVNEKGLWRVHTPPTKNGGLENGVFRPFADGPLIRVAGNTVEVGLSYKQTSYKVSTGGINWHNNYKTTSKTKVYNIYKDKNVIKELISMLKK